MIHPLCWPIVSGIAAIGVPIWMMPNVPIGSERYLIALLLPWQLYRTIRSTLFILRWWQRRQPVSSVVATRNYDPQGIMVGHGFRVTAKHTQALEELTREDDALPLDEGDLSGFPALHAVGGIVDTPVRIPWLLLNGHVGIWGTTGSGKSRMLELMLASLIHAEERGPIITIDPKGDEELEARVRYEAQASGRPYYYIRASDPGGSARLNPLAVANSTAEVAARIEVMMPVTTANSIAIFTDYPIALVEVVAGAQKALGIPWSLAALAPPLLERFFLERLFGHYVQTVYGIGDGSERLGDKQRQSLREKTETDAILSGFFTVLDDPPEQANKMLRALFPGLRGVQSGPFGDIFGGRSLTEEESLIHTVMSWEQVEREGAVVYIGLDNFLYGTQSDRMSRLVLADVIGYVAQRYILNADGREPISLVVDELSLAIYPGFINALSQGRGADLRVVISTQSQADLIDKLNSRSAAQRCTANINTKIYLKTADPETKKAVSDDFGSVNIAIAERGAAVTHSPERGASMRVDGRKQYRPFPLVNPEHLEGLPRGQAYAKIRGQAYKLRVPLLPDIDRPIDDATPSCERPDLRPPSTAVPESQPAGY